MTTPSRLTRRVVSSRAQSSTVGAVHWLRSYFDRIGHVYFENPIWLVRFGLRLVTSTRFAPELAWSIVTKTARQIGKTFLRGFFLVLALGTAAAIGIGWVSERTSALARNAFDTLVVPLVVEDVIPLALAVVLAARTGATIAVRFAVVPLEQHKHVVEFGPRDLQREVVPHLLAGVVTAGIFFLLIIWLFLKGYHSGPSPLSWTADVSPYFSWPAVWNPLLVGGLKSLIFGLVVATTAAGLGIQVAERHERFRALNYGSHYVVWETVLISMVLCTVINLVI